MTDRTWLKLSREQARHKQDSRCKYCRSLLTAETATADHIHPLSKGGSDDKSNIVACCRECNLTKGKMPVSEFKRKIKNPPRGERYSVYLLLAHMRYRLSRRTELACKNIRRATGKRVERNDF